MEDPRFVVPYHDPHDTPLSPSVFNLANPTLTLDDLTNIFGPNNTLPQQQNRHGVQAGDPDPYFDPMIQDHFVHNDFPIGGGEGSFEARPSSQVHVDQGQLATNDILGPQNYNDVITLAHWPQPPVPFSCSCCLVLREIVHTNGFNFTKLEIHGRPGMISHVIQHPTVNMDYSSSSNLQHQMIDFCRKSIQDVKNFLVQYCVGQTSAGYFILQDPLSAYYEALCTGMEWTEELSDDNSDDDIEHEVDNGVGRPARRASLSVQRDRAGRMHLDDFTDYFHLPIEEASRQLNLCSTVVKKICRKEGLNRWPHRKIKSITKKISALRRTMETTDAHSSARIQNEICRLEDKMRKHCAGRYPTGLVIT